MSASLRCAMALANAARHCQRCDARAPSASATLRPSAASRERRSGGGARRANASSQSHAAPWNASAKRAAGSLATRVDHSSTLALIRATRCVATGSAHTLQSRATETANLALVHCVAEENCGSVRIGARRSCSRLCASIHDGNLVHDAPRAARARAQHLARPAHVNVHVCACVRAPVSRANRHRVAGDASRTVDFGGLRAHHFVEFGAAARHVAQRHAGAHARAHALHAPVKMPMQRAVWAHHAFVHQHVARQHLARRHVA